MPGPKPRPTALKVLHGTQKCRINDAEPTPLPGRPACPPHLEGEARAEWDRIVPQLEAMRVLTQVDGAAIALYCEIHAERRAALAEIEEHGLTIRTEEGGRKTNPAVLIAQRDAAQLMRILSDFGATASSRSKLKVTDQKESELSAFLDDRPLRSG